MKDGRAGEVTGLSNRNGGSLLSNNREAGQ